MRYVQLRAFHQVAESGGFSRAADFLNLTQPAVSDQVRRLEQDYDVLLFDRRKRQVALTETGEALLTITRRMFEAERQAGEFLSESRALRAGTLRVVADAAAHVTPVLAKFRALYPGVQVLLTAGNTETAIATLEAYEADIGVIGDRPARPGFEVLRLGASRIVACVPKGSPLAAKSRIGLHELDQYPLVMREAGSKTRMKVEQAAAAYGVTLVPAIEAEGREAVREIVASGGGIGFVSRSEFGEDKRLAPVGLYPDADLLMEELVVCLTDRAEGRLIRVFLELAGSG